jgi:hypothetical protein
MTQRSLVQSASHKAQKIQHQKLLKTFDIFSLYAGFLFLQLPQIAAVSIYPLNRRSSASRYKVLKHTISQIRGRPGLNLEFGVLNGNSLRLCSQIWPEGLFYGFDSFQGFPNDRRTDWKNDFSVDRVPEVPRNCFLIQGFFEDALPKFLDEHREPANFVNIDCDIYSSTHTVLSLLHANKRLLPGTAIHFDDLVNYREFCWNEMLALFQLALLHSVGFEWMIAHGPVRFVEEYVELIETDTYPLWGMDKQTGYRQQVTLAIRSQPIDLSILFLPHMKAKCLYIGSRLRRLTEVHATDKLAIFEGISRELHAQSDKTASIEAPSNP